MAFAIGRKALVYQQVLAAVLEVVALLLQFGDSPIRRTHAIYLIANVLRVAPSKDDRGTRRIDLARDHHRDFPLVNRLRNTRSRNLRAKDDPTFCAGLGAATTLFITGAGGQQQDRV